MTETSVELDVHVSMIESVRKSEPPVSYGYPSPAPAHADSREIDPNVLAVQLRHPQENHEEFVLHALMTKEHAQKLGLMAGGKLKVQIVKER